MKIIKYSAWRVLFLAAMVLALAGCSTNAEKTADFVARGDRLLAKGEAVLAVLEYKNALQIDPNNVPATTGLGKAFLAQKDYQKAYAAFRAALQLDPARDDARVEVAWIVAMGNAGQMALDEVKQIKEPEKYQPRVDFIKARAMLALKRQQEAVDILMKARDGKQDKEIQMLLAHCLRDLGSGEEMKEAVARWRAADPGDPGSYIFLAQYAAEHRDNGTAVRELQKMQDVAPGDPSRGLMRAQALESLKLYDQAEAAYRSLPDSPEMLSARADFCLRRKELVEARLLLERLLSQSPGNVDAVVKMVRLLTDRKEPAPAFDLLERTLEVDLKKSDREKILILKAELKAGTGEMEQAKSLCEAILAENQGNVDAHLLMGKLLLYHRKPREAEMHFTQVLASRPDDEEAIVLLTRCQRITDNRVLAGDTLRKAVDANPRSTRLLMELARFYFEKKEFDQARRTLDKGLADHPDDISLLKARGEFFVSRNNAARAIQDFQKIIALRPELPLGYMQIAQVALSQSRFDEAIGWYKQVLELENGWQVAIPAILNAYVIKGDLGGGLTFVRKETEKRPDSALCHFYLAQALVATGDLAGAEKAFIRATELTPEWLDPYQALAEIYIRQAKVAETITGLEESYQKKPTSPIRLQLAALYEHVGRPEDAVRLYNELLEQSPGMPLVLNNLAYLYAETSEDKPSLARGADLVGRALFLQPENPYILDTAAWIAYKQGDLDSAWNYIQQAEALGTNEGVHKLHSAIVLNGRGDRERAKEYLTKALGLKLDEKSREKALTLKKKWEGG